MPLAFDVLDPLAVCEAFSRGLNRPVRYVEGPIEVSVTIPEGYQKQLDALEDLFGGEVVGGKNAPYWWDGIFDTWKNNTNGYSQGEDYEIDPNARVARSLWEGWRDIEGYARDIFPVEERLNGKDWMEAED